MPETPTVPRISEDTDAYKKLSSTGLGRARWSPFSGFKQSFEQGIVLVEHSPVGVFCYLPRCPQVTGQKSDPPALTGSLSDAVRLKYLQLASNFHLETTAQMQVSNDALGACPDPSFFLSLDLRW